MIASLEAGKARVKLLTEALSDYMPKIIAMGVVRAALRGRGLSNDSCPAEQFGELVAHCRTGLSLFVAPERLPLLMLALAELIDDQEGPTTSAPISTRWGTEPGSGTRPRDPRDEGDKPPRPRRRPAK